MNAELFYIFDIGDALAIPLERILRPIPARLVSQIISFTLNGMVWTAYLCLTAKAISITI